MNTTEIKISIPDSLSEDEVKTILAVKLYELEKISLGQAAKIAGFSHRAFMEILGKYQVPIFNYSPAELQEELEL